MLANTVGPAKPPVCLGFDSCCPVLLLPSWFGDSCLEDEAALGESAKLVKAYKSSSSGPSSSSDSTACNCVTSDHHLLCWLTHKVVSLLVSQMSLCSFSDRQDRLAQQLKNSDSLPLATDGASSIGDKTKAVIRHYLWNSFTPACCLPLLPA